MIHKHDFELIAAIAEGGMDPDKQAVAEASLVSCEACSSDLQLQREALAAIHDAPPVAMTDLERAALHRSVAAALTPVNLRPDSKPIVPWFQRLMPAMAAAAALLVVVGVGSVLVNGTGDADTAAETTTVAGDSLRTAPDEELGGASNDAQFEEAPAATTTTMAGFPAAEARIVQDYGAITGADLADIARRLDIDEQDDLAIEYSEGALQSLARDAALLCAEIALDEGLITTIARAVVDGDDVEIYLIDDIVQVYSTADCSLIDPFE